MTPAQFGKLIAEALSLAQSRHADRLSAFAERTRVL
jgi:hypothetical protein